VTYTPAYIWFSTSAEHDDIDDAASLMEPHWKPGSGPRQRLGLRWPLIAAVLAGTFLLYAISSLSTGQQIAGDTGAPLHGPSSSRPPTSQVGNPQQQRAAGPQQPGSLSSYGVLLYMPQGSLVGSPTSSSSSSGSGSSSGGSSSSSSREDGAGSRQQPVHMPPRAAWDYQ
jgi:hypothetical protein